LVANVRAKLEEELASRDDLDQLSRLDFNDEVRKFEPY